MEAGEYWKLFMDSGAPEMYLLYAKQLKLEENHVFNRPGHCAQGHRP